MRTVPEGDRLSDRRYFLTAREVMAIYRLGRNAVYDLANRYIETDGAEGIPCHRYGKQLRFPIAAIEHDIGAPIDLPIPDQATPDGSIDARSCNPSADGSQAALPFAS